MVTLKDVLCLLAIFIAYGITGRLDYEDAERQEQTRHERLRVDCFAASPPTAHPPVWQISDLPVDQRSGSANGRLPSNGMPCARQLF